MVTFTMTTVSPQRTTQEPFACSAYFPVSMMTFLPPISVSNCLKFFVILHSLLFVPQGSPCRPAIYKRAEHLFRP